MSEQPLSSHGRFTAKGLTVLVQFLVLTLFEKVRSNPNSNTRGREFCNRTMDINGIKKAGTAPSRLIAM